MFLYLYHFSLSKWKSEFGGLDDLDVPASTWKLNEPNGINCWAICTFNAPSKCGCMDVNDREKKTYNSKKVQNKI
jgi:hypothetical protein